MDDHGIAVADERRILARGRLAAGGIGRDGQRLAVGGDDDLALGIGAIDRRAQRLQPGQHVRAGMTVVVILPDADDGDGGRHSLQKGLGGAGRTSMVSGLQHVGPHIRAGGHQVGLRVLLHVAGEEEARPAVVDAQDQTAVIGVGIRLHRPDDLDARAAERPAVACLRHLDGVPLLVGVFDDVGEDLRRVFRDARIDVLRRVFGQHGGKAPAVVLVRMCVDHIGQPRHVQPVQAGDEELPLLDRAAVDEHGLVPAGEHDAVALPDVEEADGERLIRRCLLRCGGRRRRLWITGFRFSARAEIRHKRNDNNDQHVQPQRHAPG